MLWLCRCECGSEKLVPGHNLRSCAVTSCGCLKREMGTERLRRFRESSAHPRIEHGECVGGNASPEWLAWRNLHQKGAACERWSDWKSFLSDMGRRPGPGYSLCRPRADQPYGPGNAVWGSAAFRARHRKTSFNITCFGETLNIAEWAERSGVGASCIRSRIKNGWSPEEAIFSAASVSEGLKRTWAAGRIRPRRPVYAEEETKARNKARSLRRYAENREIMCQKFRDWNARNPERKKEISARYVERNRDQINARSRELYQKPEKKAWAAAYRKKHRSENPELYLTYCHNRRARKRNATGSHTRDEWLAKVERAGGRCVYCGNKGRMTRDHNVPLSRGGSNLISNIEPACRRCNSRKHDLTGEEFLSRLVEEARPMTERWIKQLTDARSKSRKNVARAPYYPDHSLSRPSGRKRQAVR